MFASYLVSSLSLMVCFAITSFQCLLLADFFGLASFDRCSPKTEACLVASSVGGSLSFLVPFFFCSILANRPNYSFFSLPVYSLGSHLSLSLVFYWPAILTPKYPASGAALPLHLILFWPVILTPGYPVSSSSLPLHLFLFDRLFWRPAIRFLVSLSRSDASSFDRLFWRPAIRFPVPLSRSASPFFDRLFWRPAIRFSFLSPTPPRLLLTGYFDARLSGFRCLSPAPPHPFWPVILTPGYPVLVPLSRSAASSPDRLFYRPDIRFSMPRDLLFTPRFWSSFSTPSFFPTQPSLPGYLGGRLALCAAFRLACGFFYRFQRFLPLRGFYRSAVFTAPRFLPLRGFYRSAIFSAPLSPVLWGALLFLSALQSSPSSGRILCYRLLRRVSGGTPFLIFFWTTCLTALGALPLTSPVSLLYLSYTLGDHRSSRLLTDGTRAPRVLPPPSWDLSAIGN